MITVAAAVVVQAVAVVTIWRRGYAAGHAAGRRDGVRDARLASRVGIDG